MSGEPAGDDWVTVAVMLRPHGMHGMCRLKPLTRNPEDFLDAEPAKLKVRRNGRIEGELTFEEMELVDGGIIFARFAEIADRTAAERYVNCDLVIPESERWPLTEGYYVDHLVGLELRDTTGKRIGEVITGRDGAAHDYLAIRLDGAVWQGELLLPLIPQFVHKIDIEGKYAEVTIPEGLAD
jgi:16S rRNA processing protein RimM